MASIAKIGGAYVLCWYLKIGGDYVALILLSRIGRQTGPGFSENCASITTFPKHNLAATREPPLFPRQTTLEFGRVGCPFYNHSVFSP
jgi:hypothetical protein